MDGNHQDCNQLEIIFVECINDTIYKESMNVVDELEKIWKEVIFTHFKVLFQDLSGNGKSNEKPVRGEGL
jgi:hypothetical protein